MKIAFNLPFPHREVECERYASNSLSALRGRQPTSPPIMYRSLIPASERGTPAHHVSYSHTHLDTASSGSYLVEGLRAVQAVWPAMTRKMLVGQENSICLHPRIYKNLIPTYLHGINPRSSQYICHRVSGYGITNRTAVRKFSKTRDRGWAPEFFLQLPRN